MAPETMVAAVPAKTNWKNQAAKIGTEVHAKAEKREGEVCPPTKKPESPIRELPLPNMTANPTAQ